MLTDLDRGSLLEAVFDLPLVFVVPGLLYERELRPYGGDRLLKRGLQVAELDGEGVARALNFRRTQPSLSLASLLPSPRTTAGIPPDCEAPGRS